MPQRAGTYKGSKVEASKRTTISEPKSKNHANTLTTTMTRPPTYDERLDEVASIGSILSGATGKAKRGQGNAVEGALSTGVDEPHSGSTSLNAIAASNHRSSVQPPSSKYLNAVDALHGRNRGSQPNVAAGYNMTMLGQGPQQQLYQQHTSNMPPLYPVHPKGQAGLADRPAQGSMQYQNSDLLMEHLGSSQFHGPK